MSVSVGTAAVNGALELIAKVAGKVKTVGTSLPGAAKQKSLVQITNSGRVEPLTLVDADVVNLDYISDVMQAVQSLFAGYYLQAVNMINEVGNVAVIDRLNALNPTASSKSIFSLESLTEGSYRHRLPALEADDSKKEEEQRGRTMGPATTQDQLGDIAKSANLSIGKMYNVTLRIDRDSYVLPIAIRLMVNILPSSDLKELFTHRDSFDMNMKERWYAYKAGMLGFWKDLVFCQDLIAKYRRMAIQDKSGVGKVILNREAQNINHMLSGKDSYAGATSIAVVSDETIRQIERELSGKMSNSRVRKAVFEGTNLMLLVVISKEWEHVVIYTRDLDSTTTLSLKDIKKSASNGGGDVTEIMKAYLMGASPASMH